MKSKRTWWLPCVIVTLLSACGGGGGGGSRGPGVTEAVPAAVSSDPVAATNYVSALAAVPANSSDTLEPVSVPDTLASSDSAEPAAIP